MEEDTWKPKENLGNARDLVERFKKSTEKSQDKQEKKIIESFIEKNY